MRLKSDDLKMQLTNIFLFVVSLSYNVYYIKNITRKRRDREAFNLR